MLSEQADARRPEEEKKRGANLNFFVKIQTKRPREKIIQELERNKKKRQERHVNVKRKMRNYKNESKK